MDSNSFVTIADESFSFKQVCQMLKVSGGLQRMLGDFKQHYVLTQELENRSDIKATKFQINEAISNFTRQANLLNPSKFNEWLSKNHLTYDEFCEQLAFGIKVEKLKIAIAKPELEKRFEERQELCDRVVLSRILVKDKETAIELKAQLESDRSQFEAIAKEKTLLDEDKAVGGMVGTVRIGQLPVPLREALKDAKTDEIIGPVDLDGRYCLCWVRDRLPASIDDPIIQRELREVLFQEWLQKRLKETTLRLE
ncbi:peptidylprolyl isomerase [Oscillatoria sp. HE19RPO]|uniref:peptidylprolyl isomerase n=1 Tax=Oscillatoria sp. HE19RPO TaxID=2954806 RepID=UPI0020C36EFF|nr:peptidylprolyl isomerase [Oscillatoria sp. HE19RPO]